MKKIILLLLFVLSFHFGFAQQDSIFSFFNVQQENNKVVVFLTINGGIQCSGLQVQRSTDSINFIMIYEFPGVCGSPGADESYVWVDDFPVKNTIVSDPKSVFFQYYKSNELLITPNPCEDCTVRFPNDKREKVRIQLSSIDGKFLLEEETSSNFYSLSNFDLKGSIFFVSIFYENGKKITGKVLKF